MDPPLGLIERATYAEQFQISSRLEGVASDGSRALVCSHHGVIFRLFDEFIRAVAEESWVLIVLEQGPTVGI